jgi:hypothetical protein
VSSKKRTKYENINKIDATLIQSAVEIFQNNIIIRKRNGRDFRKPKKALEAINKKICQQVFKLTSDQYAVD